MMSKQFLYRSSAPQTKRLVSLSFPVISPATPQQISQLSVGWRPWLCRVFTAVLLLAGGGVAYADPAGTTSSSVVTTADRIAGFVAEASQQFAIPMSWVRAVMQVESFGDARAISSKGAMGLMQIMPETWATLRLRYGLGADPYDPHDNITAGTAYLRELHDRYGDVGFLAAYNAGPRRYEDHLATGRPLPSETRSYVSVVASLIDGGTVEGADVGETTAPSWTHAVLFVLHMETGSSEFRSSSSPQMQHRPDGMAQGRTALAPLSDGLFARTPNRSGRP